MKAALALLHTCRSPAGQDNQPLLWHQNDLLIQAIKVNATTQIPLLPRSSMAEWAVYEVKGERMREGHITLVFHLLTCCSRRVVFIAERSFWQIWQKNKPASSRLARASSLVSCWRAKARAPSCSMDGRWWVSGKEGRDDLRQKSKNPVWKAWSRCTSHY